MRVRIGARTVSDGVLFDGPVSVTVQFYLPRPKSLARKVEHHLKKPDVDKLARCLLDALTGVLIPDDRCVVELHAAKTYSTPPAEPRADVTVHALTRSLLDQEDSHGT